MPSARAYAAHASLVRPAEKSELPSSLSDAAPASGSAGGAAAAAAEAAEGAASRAWWRKEMSSTWACTGPPPPREGARSGSRAACSCERETRASSPRRIEWRARRSASPTTRPSSMPTERAPSLPTASPPSAAAAAGTSEALASDGEPSLTVSVAPRAGVSLPLPGERTRLRTERPPSEERSSTSATAWRCSSSPSGPGHPPPAATKKAARSPARIDPIARGAASRPRTLPAWCRGSSSRS
mmetsp:Transcript_31332/g.103347  ORF Transcript_31332/g.103347 Transcript_31332/m.103347 type:complete len:241 (+) Transcript_31332:170-892(+)